MMKKKKKRSNLDHNITITPTPMSSCCLRGIAIGTHYMQIAAKDRTYITVSEKSKVE